MCEHDSMQRRSCFPANVGNKPRVQGQKLLTERTLVLGRINLNFLDVVLTIGPYCFALAVKHNSINKHETQVQIISSNLIGFKCSAPILDNSHFSAVSKR